MTQEELLNLPVGLWAMDNAHLYLWTTDAFIVQAHQIAQAWGFEVKNIITWVKGRNEERLHIGVGFYFRHATEHILFSVRGSLPVLNHDQPNVFFAPRHDHSEKPAAFYDMVMHMSPPPYLDVFARCQRFGFDTWGDEAFDFHTDGIWHEGLK
jgi:N6-adenosine-specific RNA methylase IME4